MACRTWEEEEEEEEEEERSQSAAPSGRCMVERAPNTACDEECGLQGEGGGGGGRGDLYNYYSTSWKTGSV